MSELFDRARDAKRLETLAGELVKMRGEGNEQRGPCPICQASQRSGSVFKVDVGAQKWVCYACERHGDVIDLYAEVNRMTLADAARELAGPGGVTAQPVAPREKPIEDDGRAERIARMAADMYATSRPIFGTLGARYLVGRGIDQAIVDQLGDVRIADFAPHSWNPEARVWRRAPAIVNRVVTPGGWPGGVHVTYLDAETGGKAALDPPRRMWGPQGDETPFGRRRGCAWLISSFPDDGELVVAEGVESALSLATYLWRCGRRGFGVVAALSLNGLQGTLQRDADGCVDLAHPTADPAAPAFTWPPCHTASARPPLVSIAIDRDMSLQRFKGRTGRGRVVDLVLDAEARAALCAKLAVAAWRAAGWRARAVWPSPNGDWNDQLKRLRP